MPRSLIAHESPISKIFSDDYAFFIPGYQRPYSWTMEQARDLLDDLLAAMQANDGSIEDMLPYFLGSVVLIKKDGSVDADVVDGQQRLTTLTLLLSALRSCVRDEVAGSLTQLLYEQGNFVRMSKDRFRLTLRAQDNDFFKEYVQKEGGFEKLIQLTATLPSSQNHLRANAKFFSLRLRELSEEERVRLALYIVNCCYLVVVATQDLDAAYRIFSVMNSRGLDLAPTDIFKAEAIGGVPEQERAAYTKKWEDLEESLGRDDFVDLFSHLRMVYRKAKSQGKLLQEFKEHVTEFKQPKHFVDAVLIPMAKAFEEIKDASFNSMANAETINSCLRWLNRLLFTDWMPPALAFLTRHRNDPALVLRFFADLERLSFYLMLAKAGINERIERYATVTRQIEGNKDLFSPASALQLTPAEQGTAYDALSGPFYSSFSAKVRSIVLLRLDALASGGGAEYNYDVVSVEHVLPQNPATGSIWQSWFPDPKDQYYWVHRLGNLALLSRRKNSAASNYEFSRKKEVYFTKGGVSPFALTTQVLKHTEWVPGVVQDRHNELLDLLERHWRLQERRDVLAELDL